MKQYLSLVKFSHTIFALPFALLGFFLAMYRLDLQMPWGVLFYVLLCMVFARNAAMAFNRYLDRDIDEKNPRTVTRQIPAGIISSKAAISFVFVNALLFVGTAWLINPICFYLSPVALGVILGYSYTKRFTFLCHFVLGLGLALAPVGAYLAVGGTFALLPILYAAAVLFWVSGFDIIYALQDEAFDRKYNLSSVPVALGGTNALRLSTALHLGCALTMTVAGYVLIADYSTAGWLSGLATLIFILLLAYQHTLVKPHDLSRINLAFFTTNGIASLILGTMIILDLCV